jgi:diacylglycerol kinase family enzyme
MLRLGIISNPFAKLNKNNPNHNTQLWYTLANEGLYKITQSIAELEDVCHEYCQRKINCVGIVGGDGSIGLVLSKLYEAYKNEPSLPKILLLKGGTINFLASNLGIKTSALNCLNDTLSRTKRNKPLYEVVLQTIQVNDRVGFIFAGGIACAFLENFYQNKTNSFGAVLSICKILADGALAGKINGSFSRIVKRQQFSIETYPTPLWTGKPNPLKKEEYSLVFASTVPKLPLNIHLFQKVNLQKPQAEMVAITEGGSQLIKGAFQTVLGGNVTSLPGADSVIFERATLQAQSKLAYSIDGDLCFAEDGKINLTLGPSFVFCSPYRIKEKE